MSMVPEFDMHVMLLLCDKKQCYKCLRSSNASGIVPLQFSSQIMIDESFFYKFFCLFQRMVLSSLSRNSQPNVLPLPIRKHEQLRSTNQSCLLHQSGPSSVFQIHRPVHRYGALPWQIHRFWVHPALLQAHAQQETPATRCWTSGRWILQLSKVYQVSHLMFLWKNCATFSLFKFLYCILVTVHSNEF